MSGWPFDAFMTYRSPQGFSYALRRRTDDQFVIWKAAPGEPQEQWVVTGALYEVAVLLFRCLIREGAL